LQPLAELAKAGTVAGNWFVERSGDPMAAGLAGWKLFYRGAGWLLYKSTSQSTPEGPKPAEHEGLSGCKDQRHK
jgi:hypothetical protein